LFVINSDGSGTKQLAVSPLNYDPNRTPSFGGPSLSGDGSKVAFTLLTASLGSDLWIINSDGTGAGRLATSSASFLGFPSISSDGTKIAFFIQNRIEIINSDGTGNASLAFVGVATPPFISGDGSKVFFVASSEIFGVNADGTSLFQVTHLSQFGLLVVPASLSVDGLGQKVTFITSTGDLSVINSDGTGLLFVGTVRAFLSFASISDDGRKVAFSSPFKFGSPGLEQIYLIDVNGGNLRQITSVTSFGCFKPKIDATGSRIAFLSRDDLTGQNADNSTELFLANIFAP
jgi:Tol biopolymer transport system component